VRRRGAIIFFSESIEINAGPDILRQNNHKVQVPSPTVPFLFSSFFLPFIGGDPIAEQRRRLKVMAQE
jgi:hypothetical protein